MAIHALSRNFNYFFSRLNPSPSFAQKAASEHKTIVSLIENVNGPAGVLSPHCFLQGSYKQKTAIYTINDVDIVALCELWQPGSGYGSRSWSRDEIFDTIASPLLNDWRFRDKVRYDNQSICIKVDLGIKVEILPVVHKVNSSDDEPFRLYRPDKGEWVDGFARYHQGFLSWKNSEAYSNFIPAVKVLKHLNSKFGLNVTSFYIECLLFSIPHSIFNGGPADYIAATLNHIASISASDWYNSHLETPCSDRDIFTDLEWKSDEWKIFHKLVTIWAESATLANQSQDRDYAIEFWKLLLGEEFFPREVS